MFPTEILLMQTSGGGSSEEDTAYEHNKKWTAKYKNVYLKDTEGQAWDSSYFSLLDSLSTLEDKEVPYTEDTYAVLYTKSYGSYYFWLPYHVARLKVSSNAGLVEFDIDQVDEFALASDITTVGEKETEVKGNVTDLQEDVYYLNRYLFGEDEE